MSSLDGGPPLVAATSTWDDWLALRSFPHVALQELSPKSRVALALTEGLWPLVDFSDPATRRALRELFDEYEQATAGAPTTRRDPVAALRLVLPVQGVEVGRRAGQANPQVVLTMTAAGGLQLEFRLDAQRARVVGEMLYDQALDAGSGP
jgi:hypothetical protein